MPSPTGQLNSIKIWSRGSRRAAWLLPRTLATAVVLLMGTVTVAGATPRGQRPPRQWVAAGAGLSDADTQRAVPLSEQFVSRPDPTCRPRRQTLRYHGGALVKNPDVFILFWGNDWNTDPEQQNARAALVSMYQDIGSSDFACAWREYAVPGYPLGPGTYNGSYVITTEPPSPLDDFVIRQEIQAVIAAGHAPSRTDDRVYIVVPKRGVPVRTGDGSTGCGGSSFVFCGYHDSFGTTAAPFRYAVLPYPCTDGLSTCFVDSTGNPGTSLQATGAHELTELVTDPDWPPIGSGGWFTASGNENADICAAFACTDTLTVGAQTVTVNPAWSNLAKGCVTAVSCAPPPRECTDTSPGICVSGIGRTTSCEFEWLVDPNMTLVGRTQLPGRTVSCADGQAFCDADGMADGQCTFHVAACVNSHDPRLACTPAAVTSLTLTNPSPASDDPVNLTNAATLLTALAGVDPNSIGTVVGNHISYSLPATTPDACTNYFDVVVPASRLRRLAVRLQTSTGPAANRLTLKCAAAVP